ncbi:MAG: Hachiman antiphage defense system protein HamA [Rhodomicrobium sp.]
MVNVMVHFNDWCNSQETNVGRHSLRVLSGDPANIDTGVEATAEVVPRHYAAEERIASILQRLGKPAAAEFVIGKLPEDKPIRSGDLGEILATEYITEHTSYEAPIKRLRWKDHRNMAMRGDDVIGIAKDPATNRLQFLKTEAKSRQALSGGVVAAAREALDKDNGLPSAHALSYIASRLHELGNNELADAIDDAQLKLGIPAQTVRHMLFTFSGNDPTAHLIASLQGYAGPIAQSSVGVRIEAHADFIRAVYDLVIANANND